MKIIRYLLALALSVVLATGAGRAATWEGDLLNVQLLVPNPQTVAFNGNFTVPASGINISGDGSLLLSIEPSLVRLVNTTSAGLLINEPFSDIKITDTTASRIENVQVGPGSTFDPNSLISGNNFLQFGLAHVLIPKSGVLNLQVSFLTSTPEAIPEPGSLPVLASALLVLLLALWVTSGRRRRRSTRAIAT